jgi:hypothetical protein
MAVHSRARSFQKTARKQRKNKNGQDRSQNVVRSRPLGSPYRSGRSPHWVKVKNPKAPAVKREAEEDWGRVVKESRLLAARRRLIIRAVAV